MFGVGYPEMAILLVAALVIFGPGKLPEVAGQLGRAVRDFRRMTADLTGEFEKTISEVDDIKQAFRGEVDSMTSQVNSVTKSVKKDLAETTASLEGAAKSTGAAKTRPPKPAAKTVKTAGKSAVVKAASGNGAKADAPVATKADPLADVSFLDDEAPTKPPRVPVVGAAAPVAKAATNGAAVEVAAPKVDAPVPVPPPVAPAAVGNGTDANGAAGDAAAQALARARQRRAAAGYNRRVG